MAPSRIWVRNSAITSQKYLAVARMDGVMRIIASGSLAGSWGGASSRLRAWCQPSKAMPAIRNNTLNTDHNSRCDGGVLPTNGSWGQLFVYEMVAPGRSVVAAQADHQKNAVSARRCGSLSTVLSFIA